jgi:potassium efflux system protein
LLAAARRHALVLSEPAPSALFVGIGEKLLNFELRVFIANRDTYSNVIHELNIAIDDALRESGMETGAARAATGAGTRIAA